MDNAQRAAIYVATNGAVRLTPAQRRRVDKHAARAASPHASVVRVSRLRKAVERKHRREVQRVAAFVTASVQQLRKHR
jgi:hypothetical protein